MKKDVLSQYLYSFPYGEDLSSLTQLASKAKYGKNACNLVSENEFILNSPEWSKVKKWIEACLSEVMEKEELDYSVRITQSWVNRTERGQWHHRHNHPNSFLSGIFYLTPSNSHTWFSIDSIWVAGPSRFPFPSPDSVSIQKEIITKVPTSSGELIIFPSHLHHSVDEHGLLEPRYSLSFNTFPFGNFGREGRLELLTLK